MDIQEISAESGAIPIIKLFASRAGHCQSRADASEAEITNQPITAEKVFRQLLSK